MKRTIMKSFTLLVYILGLLWFVDFKIGLLVDLKSMVMLLFGTALLTLSSYKKDMKQGDLLASAKWNSQVTAYLTTFVLQFALLSADATGVNLRNEVILNCRPLLYGLLLYIFLHSLSENYEKRDNKVVVRDKVELFEKEEDFLEKIKTLNDLTLREIEIAKMILAGQTNKEIANELFISENTVKKHVYNLFKKLSVSNREQFRYMIDMGIKSI